jgi:hypothetical protein
MQDELRKTLYPPDRTALLKRIAVEKDRAIEEFVRRIGLLDQQEAALTRTEQPTEKVKPLVRR